LSLKAHRAQIINQNAFVWRERDGLSIGAARTKSDMQMTSRKDTKFVGAHRLLLAECGQKTMPAGVFMDY